MYQLPTTFPAARQRVPARHRSAAGVTLLELLQSMAIAALFVGLAVPPYQNLMTNNRRTSAMTELLLSVNQARSEALKRRRSVTLCKSADGVQCGGAGVEWSEGWIVFANAGPLSLDQFDAGDVLISVHGAVHASADIRAEDAVGGALTFRPTGRARNAGVLLWCDHRGEAEGRALTVLPSGNAAVSHAPDNPALPGEVCG